MAQFKDLLVFGTTRVLDVVYAKKFIGPLEGTANRAISDKNGKDITEYVSSIAGDGTSSVITYTKGDGTTGTFTTTLVANDLVTNVSTSALSAAQGVVLKNAINWESWDPVTPEP